MNSQTCIKLLTLSGLLLLIFSISHSKELGSTPYHASVSTSGEVANKASEDPDISDDGNYIVFRSEASNLADSDLNNGNDIFLHDRNAGTTLMISRPIDANPIDFRQTFSLSPSISADGRFVAFATNGKLVPEDEGATFSQMDEDVYVYDRVNGTYDLISVYPSLSEGWGSTYVTISENGRYVAYRKRVRDENLTILGQDILVYDRQSGTTKESIYETTGMYVDNVNYIDLTPSGKYLIFQTGTSLTPADTGTTDIDYDIYLIDLEEDAIEMVSVLTSGLAGGSNTSHPSISDDGNIISFDARPGFGVPALNQERTHIRDRKVGETYNVMGLGPHLTGSIVSHDGCFMIYRQGEGVNLLGIYSKEIVKVDSASTGTPYTPVNFVLSTNGIHTAYQSGLGIYTQEIPRLSCEPPSFQGIYLPVIIR